MARARARRFGALSLVASVALAALAACGGDRETTATATALDDEAVTIGSFDFTESQVVAEIYGQALEAEGVPVVRAFDIGPRELVAPALQRGLIELVPEYAGTALQFVLLNSSGDVASQLDAAATHEALDAALQGTDVVPLEASPAMDNNTFVVTAETAARLDLETLSDLAPIAHELSFGGPPECENRPLCLAGLRDRYGIEFREVVSLDAGGALTLQALEGGYIDVALLFSTDPAIGDDGLVELRDDRRLQPAENVTPLVRTEVVDRWGDDVVATLDAVSARLTTDVLQRLNRQIADGSGLVAVAGTWLAQEGLR